MSEVLASLKKIGGSGEQYTETVLWTNSAPTSSFAAQTITLSDSMSNYKYLKFRYKNTASGSLEASVICPVSDFVKMSDVSGNGILLILAMQNPSIYGRRVYYVSTTSVNFKSALRVGSSGTTDSVAIPLEILGINELK